MFYQNDGFAANEEAILLMVATFFIVCPDGWYESAYVRWEEKLDLEHASRCQWSV